jgi:2-methylcitrate dehydratase PrpD
VLAVALADGAASLAQFTDARVADPDVVRLRELVAVHVDPDQTKDSARVVVNLRDGRSLERHVAHNLGTPDNPMSDGQLEEKFTGLVAPLLGEGRTAELAATCWKLEELADAASLTAQTVPALG